MLNLYKLIEILISLQSIILSSMIPFHIQIPFFNKLSDSFEIPTTWQLPTIILLTLIFHRKVVFLSFSTYILVGLFIYPVFHQGGSIGYLLTPNFGYLLGTYPLIKIMDNLNKMNKITLGSFLKYGIFAISAMHLTGIFYNFIQVAFYSKLNVFLYNLGKYSVGKYGYHLIMLIPIIFVIKPIKYIKNRIK